MVLKFLSSGGSVPRSTSMIVLTSSGLILSTWYLHFLWKKWKFKNIDGPPTPSFILGHLSETIGAIANWFNTGTYPEPFLSWTIKYGGAIYLREVTNHVVLLTDPKAIQHVLVANSANYQRHPAFQSFFADVTFGPGLLSCNGQHHGRFRRMLNPLFSVGQLKGFVEVFDEHARQLVDKTLKEFDNQEVDIYRVFDKVTLDIIGATAFGIDFSTFPEASKAFHDFNTPLHPALTVGMMMVPGFVHLPLPPLLKRRRAHNKLHKLMIDVIDLKLQKPMENDQRKDLLDLLLPSATKSEAVTHTMSFMSAGHSTSAATLGWVFALLATRPEVVERIRNEYNAVVKEFGSLKTWESVAKLIYTSAVIQETLRLHPVATLLVPLLSLQDDNLPMADAPPVSIPSGATIQVGLMAMHRNPKYWRAPEIFEPERFIEGTPAWQADFDLRGVKSHAFFYMPFSAGAKICLGQRFAMTELQVLLSTICSKYTFTLMPDADLRPLFEESILRPAKLLMKFQQL